MGAQIMLAQATNTPPDIVLWTDAVQAVAEAAGAVGTLAALVFLGLQPGVRQKLFRSSESPL